MALDLWTNTGLSTLASGIDASQTTLTVAAGTGSRFPSANFQLVVWSSTDFSNPIDAADREIVRCTSRTGDVLTIIRGQEGTTGVAHNTAGKTYSVALIVSQKFRDDIENRLNFLDQFLNPEDKFYFYEDFETMDSSGVPGAGAVRQAKYTWKATGRQVTLDDAVGGHVPVRGDATNSGSLILTKDGTNLAKISVQSAKPDFRARWAQRTTNAGTQRIGLIDGSPNSDPSNGIFFRNAQGAEIFAVARSGGVETTLGTGVSAVNGTFHSGRLLVLESNKLEVYLDGVLKGTITTNIPGANLGLGCGISATADLEGITVDYLFLKQNRQ